MYRVKTLIWLWSPLTVIIYTSYTSTSDINLLVKLYQNPLSGLGGVAFTRFKHVQSLIWITSLRSPLRLITFFQTLTCDTNLSIKFHQNTLEQFRRSCAYKVLTCKILNLDYLHLESSNSNFSFMHIY